MKPIESSSLEVKLQLFETYLKAIAEGHSTYYMSKILQKFNELFG